MSTDKCPNCGAALEICFVRLDGGTQAPVMLKCHIVRGSGTITHSLLCQESADRQKVENELYETLHRIKERGEEIERLRGEKCAAQGEAERERLARIKMHDEMERQACLATELRTELAETRRKLEEWHKIAGDLAAALGETNKADPIPGADEALAMFKQAEKGGWV